MGEIINQYELLTPFQNKNAGFSRWAYASKGGKAYFLKEFLDPVYPTEGALSEELTENRILDCKEYEVQKKALYEAINKASDGNAVRIAEFFREDNHYYIATERIFAQKIDLSAMASLPYEKRYILCKALAHTVMMLHREHIVHADIKSSNILLKLSKSGHLIGKLIDFDASFFEACPPASEEELGGDQVYLSPEACRFMCGETVRLSCKADIFALGLLFHQYLTGELPGFDKEEYDYAFDAVLDDQELEISSSLRPELQRMLRGMLEADPDRRLSAKEVYAVFTAIDAADMGKTVTEDTAVKENKNNGGDWFHSAGDL